MNTVDILHSRRAMYLMPYEKKVDAASFFVNFLIAVFDSQELGCPNSIDITSAGQYFSIQANGCSFPESIDSVASLFDIANYRQPFFDEFYSLGFMRPLVWFSDYCSVDFTSNGKLSQQAFLQGTPLAQNGQLPLYGKAAKIGFWFTLPTKMFEEVTLDIDRLRRVVTAWEKGELAPRLSADEIRPILHKQWSENSKYNHSLTISTNDTTNTPQIMETLAAKQDLSYQSGTLALATA